MRGLLVISVGGVIVTSMRNESGICFFAPTPIIPKRSYQVAISESIGL